MVTVMGIDVAALIREFVEKSVQFGTVSNRSQIKELESFFDNFRRTNVNAFSVCCYILCSSDQLSDTAKLLASQTLCWLCKRQGPQSGVQQNYSTLCNVLLSLQSQADLRLSHPVIVQVCLSLSSIILHLCAENIASHFGNTPSPTECNLTFIINDLISRGIDLRLVLLTLSTVPELCVSIREYIFPLSADISNSSNNNSSGGHNSHVNKSQTTNPANLNAVHELSVSKFLRLKEQLLQESAVVAHVLHTALNLQTMSSIVPTQLFALQCCTQWVEFISPNDLGISSSAVVDARKPHGNAARSPQTTVVAVDASLCGTTLDMWMQSAAVGTAVSILSHTLDSVLGMFGGAPNGAGNDQRFEVFGVCSELITALCKAAQRDLTGQLTAHIALKVLPLLSGLLTNISTNAASVITTVANRSSYPASTEHSTDTDSPCEEYTRHVLSVTRMVTYSGSHLVSAVVRLQLNSEGGVVWADFVHALTTFLGGQIDSVYGLPVAAVQQPVSNSSACCAYSETIVSLRQFAQELVQTNAPFWLELIPLIYSSDNNKNNNDNNNSREGNTTQLRTQFSGSVECMLSCAVKVSAYVESPECLVGGLSLQHQEDLYEYRISLRETLREVVSAVSSVGVWLLGHACDSLQTYSAAVEQTVSGVGGDLGAVYGTVQNVGDLLALGAGWTLPEALLHAVSAITKLLLNKAAADAADGNCGGGGSLVFEQARCVFRLLHTLTSSTACTYCRPLARMAVVLISELLPSLVRVCVTHSEALQHNSELTITSLQSLYKRCANYLMVSISAHLEQGYVCVGYARSYGEGATVDLAIRVQQRLSVALSTTGDGLPSQQAPLPLHLIYQGWFLVFRVKQDHIGAVSLCKLFTSMYSAHEYSDGSLAGVRSVLFPNQRQGDTGCDLVLPSVVSALKQMQRSADGGTKVNRTEVDLSRMEQLMRTAYFTSDSQSTVSHYDPVTWTLAYCLYYLTVLQTTTTPSHYAPCITAKSFNLVYFALCTALCSAIPNHSCVSEAVCTIGQIAAPVVVGVVTTLTNRCQQQVNGASVLTSIIAPLFASGDNATITEQCTLSAVDIGQSLAESCTLTQLLLMLNELLVTAAAHCWGDSVYAGKKNPAHSTSSGGSTVRGSQCLVFLVLLEALQPVFELIAHSHVDSSSGITVYPHMQRLSFAELEAVSKVLMAACAMPCSDNTASSAEVGQRVYALLNRHYGTVRGTLQATHAQTPLLVKAACQLMRTLVTWRSVVDITALFQSMFQEVSLFGILALQAVAEATAVAAKKEAESRKITSHSNSMNIHRVNKKEKKQLQRLNSNKQEYGVVLLCEFWIVCLSASELLPVKSSSLSGGEQHAIQSSQISVGLMGWPALQSIIDTACNFVLAANYSATMCQADSDTEDGSTSATATGATGGVAMKDKQCDGFGVNTWRQIVHILALVTGPVVCQRAGSTATRDATEHGRLLANLLSTDGHLTNSACKTVTCGENPYGQQELIQLLVESERADAAMKSTLCGLSGILPSDLREELTKCLQKLYVCLGTRVASNCVLKALFSADYPVCGAVGSETNKMTFASQLQDYALAGDWKRFRGVVKTLSKG